MANLCTLRVLQQAQDAGLPTPPVSCITFGTPAIGNSALAAKVSENGWKNHFQNVVLPGMQPSPACHCEPVGCRRMPSKPRSFCMMPPSLHARVSLMPSSLHYGVESMIRLVCAQDKYIVVTDFQTPLVAEDLIPRLLAINPEVAPELEASLPSSARHTAEHPQQRAGRWGIGLAARRDPPAEASARRQDSAGGVQTSTAPVADQAEESGAVSTVDTKVASKTTGQPFPRRLWSWVGCVSNLLAQTSSISNNKAFELL